MPYQLNVVLVEPEIPQNTGSIGRLCLATETVLHLIEPLGFEMTHSRLKRAGLDYWKHLHVIRYSNLKQFFESIPPQAPKVFFTKKANQSLFEYQFQPSSYLFFGKETAGLPEWVLQEYSKDTVKIPLYDSRVRSLNLANAVSIVVYETIRQLHQIKKVEVGLEKR